ncbi:MAG TPA: DRTGG domain-containing protein [Armatimonadota bacterium]|jgi:predicted transcriptional regulator
MSEVTVAQAVEALGLTVLAGEERLDTVLTGAQVSDLLSHVMAHGKAGHLWITNQTHANIVAVAALAGLAAIVVAAGFEPEAEAVIRAEEEEMPLCTSLETAYTLAGRLYQLGVR